MKAELYLVSYLSRGCGVALRARHTEVPIATNLQSKFVFAISNLCQHSSQLKVTALVTHLPRKWLIQAGVEWWSSSC
jgi:hypothetical protein